MKIFNDSPRLIAKPKYGFYLVIAMHNNGIVHSVCYIATNPNEAKYRYLTEYGKVRGKINVKFLEKKG